MPTKKKRKPNAAFMKPVQPDAALSAVVGHRIDPIRAVEIGQDALGILLAVDDVAWPALQ